MLETVQKHLNGKKVLVVGLGLQGGGLGLIQFLTTHGAKVHVTDLKTQEQLQPSIDKLKEYDITYTLGEHKVDDFLNVDMIFKGPSMRWDAPELLEAQKRNIPIEMETAFFVTHCPAKIVGITGTRGKSTTTNMIFQVLKQNGLSVHLAGNIPQNPSVVLLEKLTEKDVVVLELSSWQLSGFHRKKVSPHIAVFTNFYPDHLNYYKDMEEYYHDKKAIYLYQNTGDYLVANTMLKERVEQDKIPSTVYYFSADDFPEKLTNIQGQHNFANAAGALKVAELFNLDRKKSIDSIKSFGGLPYRQELIRVLNGVSFINDTTSTTPVATINALKSFTDRPVVLLFGGNSKGLPTDEVMDSLEKATHIVLLKGTQTDEMLPEIKKRYGGKVSQVYDIFEPAVEEAYKKAQSFGKSSYVILSPGATSFGMFKNEFHRGEEFNRIVKEMLQ